MVIIDCFEVMNSNRKRLIFSAYANLDNANTSVNISNNKERCSIYYRNIVVALTSAKVNNFNCDVALVTNQNIPEEYLSILSRYEILIINCAFDSFYFKGDYAWTLAFYKLCAYTKVLSFDYDDYLMIDSDVFVQNSLNMLWNWTPDYLVMMDTDETTERWQNELHSYLETSTYVTHWGGEFIAGSKSIISHFIGKCKVIFDDMLAKDFTTIHGDEFIESVVIYLNHFRVKHAGMFVYRFWTRTDYRVKTTLPKGGISVLHVPAEKEYGMLNLYRYIVRYNSVPKQHLAQKILHLHGPSFNVAIKRILLSLKQIFMNR